MRWGRGRCASRDPVARGTEARTPRSLWWLSRRRPPRFSAGGCGKPSPRSRRQRGPGTARQAWRSMSRSRGESCAEGCEERRGRWRQGRCPCFSRSCLLEIGGMARAHRAHGSSRGRTRLGCRGAGAWERLPRRCRCGSRDVEPAGDRAVQGVAQILRRSVPRGDRAVPACARDGAGAPNAGPRSRGDPTPRPALGSAVRRRLLSRGDPIPTLGCRRPRLHPHRPAR